MNKQFWHFLPDDGMTRYEPRVLVVPGQTLRIEDEPILCERGFHASLRALDALQYAPGALVQRCTLGGIVLDGGDKHVGQERTCLWVADATRVLHEFTCDTAETALNNIEARGKAVDPRSRQAIAVKRAWLVGAATDQELAAWVAAWDAARVAAWDAARTAAWVAAWGAWGAANAAARAAANADLERRLLTLAPKE